MDEILEELVSCLDHPALPLLQWNEEFSYVESRLPTGLGAKLNAVTTEHELALNSAFSPERMNSEFPGRQLIRILREAVEVSNSPWNNRHECFLFVGLINCSLVRIPAKAPTYTFLNQTLPQPVDGACQSLVLHGAFISCGILRCFACLLVTDVCAPPAPSVLTSQTAPASDKAMLQQQLEPLMRVAKAHARGPEEYARSIVQEVLSLFADVEEKFQSSSGLTTEQEMIDTLRKSYPNDHQAVLDMVISHQGLGHKMELVKRILSTLVLPAPVPYRALLRRFAALSSKATADVALRAQQLLVRSPLRQRCSACQSRTHLLEAKP